MQISFRDKQDGKLLNSLKLNLKKIEGCDFVINCCAVKNPQNKYDYFINAKLPAMIQRYINRKKLNLVGSELISVMEIENGINPSDKIKVEIKYASGEIKKIQTLCRIDTKNELEYYKNGGILQYVLRNMI